MGCRPPPRDSMKSKSFLGLSAATSWPHELKLHDTAPSWALGRSSHGLVNSGFRERNGLMNSDFMHHPLRGLSATASWPHELRFHATAASWALGRCPHGLMNSGFMQRPLHGLMAAASWPHELRHHETIPSWDVGRRPLRLHATAASWAVGRRPH